MKQFKASNLLKEARRRAGLTQRELAKRANKAQSVIARIESGRVHPTTKTLNLLLSATGFELDTALRIQPVKNSHMLEDVARILAMNAEQRLTEVYNINRFANIARRA